ncbi:helix-turn-helix domain-containing protein [Pseudorhodobacter sp.]|uniref:helix-turn-helix domain-containing protein n=1 Tax=Pseudorhodobacter sp. TaxID=1934400 RepID=UPI002AFFB51F|nr:helix-turn-helix domain-containing protein [Pseudorhodobacter sp.]
MAKAKYISDFERDVIRIGVSRGIKAPAIARFLGRQKMAVYNHIAAMEADGTIGNVPLAFVADEIARAINAKE